MELLIPSFLAGVLTILAPCVLALLPVILAGSLHTESKWRPLIIIGSLTVSVVAFTILLKFLTIFIAVPPQFWTWVSGGLVTFFGLTMIFPSLWEWIANKFSLHKSNELLQTSSQKEGVGGAILLGASLGPVFTSCSPTYAIILSVVLPTNFSVGLINLIVYAIGMAIPLLIIAYGGKAITSRLRFAANPHGWFKRTLGVIILAAGLLVLTGYDKVIEAKLVEAGYGGFVELDQSLSQDKIKQ